MKKLIRWFKNNFDKEDVLIILGVIFTIAAFWVLCVFLFSLSPQNWKEVRNGGRDHTKVIE